MSLSAFRVDAQDTVVFVYAKQRGSRSRILGVKEGELHLAVAAPPAEGAANAEVVKLISKTLGISKSRVVLEKGQASRHKQLRLSGVSLAMLQAHEWALQDLSVEQS